MTAFPPDDIRQYMRMNTEEEENMSDQRPSFDRFKVNFDAQIKGPIETVPWQPKNVSPHWDHKPAVIAATVAIIAIVTMVVCVLVFVTPFLYSPN